MNGSSILSLLPGFTSEAQQLFTLLSGVTLILMFLGLVLAVFQGLQERSFQSVGGLLMRLTVCALLVASIATWGNLIAGAANDIVSQLGLNTVSGGVYTAYQKAIAQKWGSDSAAGQPAQAAATTPAGQGAPAGATAQPGAGTMITAYGYPGDTSPDSNSAAGIGNHNNQLVPLQSAALTATAAQQYGVSLGQNFTVTAANGTTYNLVYADTAPESASRIDIYDPEGNLSSDDNNFSSNAVSVTAGDMTTPAGAGYPTLSGTISKLGDSLNIMLLWPLTHMLSLMALGIMWIMQAVQNVLFQIEIAVAPIFIGMLAVRGLSGIATKFFCSLVAIACWGIGWAVCDLLTTAIINIAVNPANNVVVTAVSPITALGVWIMLAVWVIGSSIFAPLVVSVTLMQGSSGIAAVFGATIGAAAARIGGAATATLAASSVAASNGSSPVVSSSSLHSSTNGVRPSFASRPGFEATNGRES
jgi:hypothetical protein